MLDGREYNNILDNSKYAFHRNLLITIAEIKKKKNKRWK